MSVTLATEAGEQTLAYDDLGRGHIEVEFNRPRDEEGGGAQA